jgi:hypothetical protein
MSLEEPEILPPVQPTLFCAECGSGVYPTALLCATCGRNLHEPGATSSERLDAPAISKNFKPDFIIGEYLFAVLLGVVFVILWLVSELHMISAKNLDIFDGIAFGGLILVFARGIILLLDVYFDRR